MAEGKDPRCPPWPAGEAPGRRWMTKLGPRPPAEELDPGSGVALWDGEKKRFKLFPSRPRAVARTMRIPCRTGELHWGAARPSTTLTPGTGAPSPPRRRACRPVGALWCSISGALLLLASIPCAHGSASTEAPYRAPPLHSSTPSSSSLVLFPSAGCLSLSFPHKEERCA
jgi:hypothetical protein